MNLKGQVKVYFQSLTKKNRNLLTPNLYVICFVMISKKQLAKIAQPIIALFLILGFSCKSETNPIKVEEQYTYLDISKGILDYRITPKDSIDRSGLMFSDQGAWFAYSFPKTNKNITGFSG